MEKLFKVMQFMKWSFTYFWLGQHIWHGKCGLHPAGAAGTLLLLTNLICWGRQYDLNLCSEKLCRRFSTRSWTYAGFYAMHSCSSLRWGNLSMLGDMHKGINNYSLQSGIWSCILHRWMNFRRCWNCLPIKNPKLSKKSRSWLFLKVDSLKAKCAPSRRSASPCKCKKP